MCQIAMSNKTSTPNRIAFGMVHPCLVCPRQQIHGEALFIWVGLLLLLVLKQYLELRLCLDACVPLFDHGPSPKDNAGQTQTPDDNAKNVVHVHCLYQSRNCGHTFWCRSSVWLDPLENEPDRTKYSKHPKRRTDYIAGNNPSPARRVNLSKADIPVLRLLHAKIKRGFPPTLSIRSALFCFPALPLASNNAPMLRQSAHVILATHYPLG